MEESKDPTVSRLERVIMCTGHSRPVPDVSFSPLLDNATSAPSNDDTPLPTEPDCLIISAGLDKTPMLRRGDNGDWIGSFIGHKGAVWSARLDQSAKLAVTASADFSAKIWSAVDGDELSSIDHKHIVKIAVFGSEAATVYTGGMEKIVRVVDVATNQVTRTFEGHNDSINCLVSVNESDVLWSASGGSKDNSVRLWDSRTGTSVEQIDMTGEVTTMEISQDRKWMVICSSAEILIWDIVAKKLFKSFPSEKGKTYRCAALDSSKHYLLTGAKEELWARLLNVDSGAEVELFKGHHGHVRSASFSPTQDSFATASEDGTIRIWKYRLPS
jgi:serine-threonine kinase receptor-associated protein